jgi:poly(hydroxyalkanoate) depolymerase family esterase
MVRNKTLPLGLIEATRLTRAGRLLEATALIQRTLRSSSPGMDEVGGRSRHHDREASNDPIDAAFSHVADVASPGVSAPPHAVGAEMPRRPTHDRQLLPGRTRATGGHETRGGQGQPGQFVSGSYANQSGARPYKLYIPTTYTGQALPLVVMLHGCTQTADDFANGTRMNVLAEEWQCLVLYPEQSHGANHSRCWNWFKRSDQRRDQGEPAILAGMTREVMDRYGAARGRVYVAGLSAGGAMAAVMGTAYPELYAAVGIHSGLAYGSAHDLRSALAAMGGRAVSTAGHNSATPPLAQPTPTIVFHGDRDKTVHPRNSEQVVAQVVQQWNSSSTHASTERGRVPGGHAFTRTVYRDAMGRAVVEHWMVHAAGHAWFGGSARGSHVDAKGPNAAREMLRFFYQSSSERG